MGVGWGRWADWPTLAKEPHDFRPFSGLGQWPQHGVEGRARRSVGRSVGRGERREGSEIKIPPGGHPQLPSQWPREKLGGWGSRVQASQPASPSLGGLGTAPPNPLGGRPGIPPPPPLVSRPAAWLRLRLREQNSYFPGPSSSRRRDQVGGAGFGVGAGLRVGGRTDLEDSQGGRVPTPLPS